MNIKAYLAEFVATFTLIFIGVGSIVADYITGGASGLFGVALAHGLAIAVMVAATAAISGGHINPAITIGLWTAGKIDFPNAIGYIVSQCLGAIVAMLLLKLCVPSTFLWDVKFGMPAVSDVPEITTSMAFFTEVILTFLLMFVIYGAAVDRRATKLGALYIGLVVCLDILMGGPISGAAMNPARHLGPAIFGGGLADSWLYWLAPITGAVLAAQIYRHFLEEKSRPA